MELSGLTDADIRKIRDMSRRINAGAGSQRSHHKRRRGRQGGGSTPATGGSLVYALVTSSASGATLSGGKILPGGDFGVAVLHEWGAQGTSDENYLVPQKDDDGNPITKGVINLSFNRFNAGASSIPAVGFIDPDKDLFVICSFMNAWAYPEYDPAAPQVLRKKANDSVGWGGKKCDEA